VQNGLVQHKEPMSTSKYWQRAAVRCLGQVDDSRFQMDLIRNVLTQLEFVDDPIVVEVGSVCSLNRLQKGRGAR
jgi:hypothetical protein